MAINDFITSMQLNSHRLNVDDEQKLINHIQTWYKKLINLNRKANSAEYQQTDTIMKYENFIEAHALHQPQKVGNDIRKLKRLCYKDVPELLEITGLTWKDVIEITATDFGQKNISATWANETERTMCSYCDQASSEFRKAILNYIKSAMPPSLTNAVEYPDMSTRNCERLFELTLIRSPRYMATSEIMNSLNLRMLFKLRKKPEDDFSIIPLGQLHTLYTEFDVSPHWLLGLGDTACVLAQNIETEKIMDYFCMLPDTWQSIFAQSVSKACLQLAYDSI